MDKKDMSTECGFKYQENWCKMADGTMSQEEFDEWYSQHCGKCTYMCEICMYGEE